MSDADYARHALRQFEIVERGVKERGSVARLPEDRREFSRGWEEAVFNIRDRIDNAPMELSFAPGADPREVALRQADRRERIATAVLAGIWSGNHTLRNVDGEEMTSPKELAICALEQADALIAELDKGNENA